MKPRPFEYRSDPQHSLPRRAADRVGAVFSRAEAFASNVHQVLHGTDDLGRPAAHVGELRQRLGRVPARVAQALRATEMTWHDHVTSRF